MSSAYANTFKFSLPIFIPPVSIFILCIAFCNTKLNRFVDFHLHVIPSHYTRMWVLSTYFRLKHNASNNETDTVYMFEANS